MEGRAQRESQLTALRESLSSGDLESVKRTADALHSVGGDPVIALSSMVLNELPDGDQRALALRALEHLDSRAAASVAQRFGVFLETTEAKSRQGDLLASASVPRSDPSKRWIFGLLIALAVLWPAYSIYRFNHSGPSQPISETTTKPQAESRTPADILTDLEREKAAGRPDAALKLAQDLMNAHGGTPEADKAAKQIPGLKAAIKAAEEKKRIQAAKAAAAAEAQRLADK